MEEAKEKYSYQERREAKRKQQATDEKAMKRKQVAKRSFFFVIILAVFVLLGLWIANQGPKGPDYSKAFPIMGRDHIPLGSPRPAYNSNPPSSGPHYAEPAREGFYETPLPDEQLVHNLEHGDIWIAYHPRVSADVKKRLRSFAGGKVIVTPRKENEFDVSLVAWGRVDGFNLQIGSAASSAAKAEYGVIPQERVSDFIKRYIDRGPEKIPSQAMGHGGF